MNNTVKYIFLILALTSSLFSLAQQQNLPLNREFGLVNQKVFNDFNSNFHTSFQPINQSLIQLDTISGTSKSEKKYYLINISKSEKKSKNFFKWIYRSFAHENFLAVDTGNFYLTVDPLFNIEMGKDSKDNSGDLLSKNTRGIIVRSNVGKKFSFETSLYENQMTLPSYLDSYVKTNGIVPGQGRVKDFKQKGFDFSSSSANVSYTPAKWINLQLGTGKHFIGDGYRSLLLSDASFNYPYWKIITTFGKKDQFQYTKLNASLSSITRRDKGSTPEPLFKRKTMSTHYFSWLATKWLNIGLFESTLWQTEDSNGTKPLQYQQFNPIIGVNTATTGFENPNHTIIGANLKITFPFKTVLYNQFVYDGGSKSGYQIGIKYFGIKNLTLQAEYISIAPYTYSSTIPLQTYSNYNEQLAHPNGGNVNEFIGILNYKYKRIFTQIKGNLINRKSINNNPNLTSIVIQAHLGFLVNPKNNMSIVLGINNRIKHAAGINFSNGTNYMYFGFRTSLRNLYDDF